MWNNHKKKEQCKKLNHIPNKIRKFSNYILYGSFLELKYKYCTVVEELM